MLGSRGILRNLEIKGIYQQFESFYILKIKGLKLEKQLLNPYFQKDQIQNELKFQKKKYQKQGINLIHKSQNEIKLFDELCMMISSILCFDEIDRFKKNKQNKYYEILIKVSYLEQQLNELYIKFWSEVSKGTEAEVVV